MFTHPTTFQEIYMWKQHEIIYLHFDFYNGACSTSQLNRLQLIIEKLSDRDDFTTLVLMGKLCLMLQNNVRHHVCHPMQLL